LWQGCKNRMTMQNRQKSNAKIKNEREVIELLFDLVITVCSIATHSADRSVLLWQDGGGPSQHCTL